MAIKLEFTVEILETWVKKVKVAASNRGEALAKAKADFITEKESSQDPAIAFDPESECRSVDFQLEWPEGNPKEIN